MRKAINWGIQVNKRTVRMIKLERLLRCSVGTGKVEFLAEKLAMESRGGRAVEEREKVKLVRQKVIMLMRDKLKDAVMDLELGRVQFNKSKKMLWKVLSCWSRGGQVDKAPRLSIRIVILILPSDTETSAATPCGAMRKK